MVGKKESLLSLVGYTGYINKLCSMHDTVMRYW